MSRHNWLIAAIEFTTGIGRTGKWFGFQHCLVQPDIVVVGKGLGNGYPISAVAMSRDLALQLKEPGFHYVQSHQNDPLGCAVGKEVIALLREEGLVERIRRVCCAFLDGLCYLMEKHELVEAARGRGMLLALEFQRQPRLSTETAFYELFERGFLVSCYPAGNILRFDPALTIEEENISLLLENIDSIIKNALSSRSPF